MYSAIFRTELSDFGITCAIFEPGIFKTKLLDQEAKNKRVSFVWSKISAELREEYGEAYKEKCESFTSASIMFFEG